MLRPLILALALLPAAATNRPPPADPLTATIHTEDADRFAALFARTKGKPTAAQLKRDYLDKGSVAIGVFTPGRIGDAAGLDHQPLGGGLEFGEVVEGGREAVDQGAADASVRKGHRVAVATVEKSRVDVQLTEVVDEDRDPFVGDGEQIVEEGGLACAQVATEHGDGDRRRGGHAQPLPAGK